MSHSIRFLTAISFLLLAVFQLPAQVPTGIPPFGSFGGGPDIINLANLNAHLTVPVLHKPGRSTDFTYDLSYDTSVWYPIGASGSQSWQPVVNWGWRGSTEILTGYVYYTATVKRCFNTDLKRYFNYTVYSNWAYHDSFGVTHYFSGATVSYFNDACTDPDPYSPTATATAHDGSGFVISVEADPSASVFTPTGTEMYPPLLSQSGLGSFTDRNGNEISVSVSGVFTDTLGTTTITVLCWLSLKWRSGVFR
jgi:hypothetical protein